MLSFDRKSARLILTVFVMLLTTPAWSATSTVFYTVAHQDDWQLFMNPTAYHDVRELQAHVVFIYLTAGDAGYGNGPVPGHIVPYFWARELGANAAVEFIATPDKAYRDTPRRGLVRINGHPIYRVIYMNTVSYFLRLPSGDPAGNEPYPTLFNLYTGIRPTTLAAVTDVEGRWPYDREDLIETLREIIRREAAGSTNVWANIPYQYANLGLGEEDDGDDYQSMDHADHVYTGRFMYEAVKAFSCINHAEFYGYQSQYMRQNLSRAQLIREAATWGATTSGLLRTDGAWNTFDDFHEDYLGQNWYDVHYGAGPCTSGSF